MKVQASIGIIIAFLLGSLTINAQDKQMIERIEAKKVGFITDKLDLSVVESQQFWPLYNEYQEKLRAIKGDKLGLPKKPMDLSAEEANNLIREHLEMELSEVNLKTTYINKIQEVLPPEKVLRLLHIEGEFKRRLLEIMSKRRDKMNGRKRGMR